MIKKLVIVRHAKSTWDLASIADLDRPLKEIGINNTILISKKLLQNKITPDLIITSHAIRAMHTALIVARELCFPFHKIVIDSGLYHESDDEVLESLRLIDDIYPTVFIFGHNPTFTLLSNIFLNQKISNLPTSGAVILEFNCEKWKDISLRTKTSENIITPKVIRGDED
jgi:phosphohistidine phosphatase